MDITDTTATSDEVLDGEVFYAASGTRSVGTLGDATQSTHGLMSSADKTKLDGIGVMTGATSTESGAQGLVPTPLAGDQNKYLRGDGTWQNPTATLEGVVNNLIGSDTGKSIRTIAQEETARIVDNAPEAFDTLKEIAEYIANDTTNGAQMANDISDLKKSVNALPPEGCVTLPPVSP